MKRNSAFILMALIALANCANASRLTTEMKEGKADFQSMGPLTFGPDGIIFIADTKAAAITAISTGDTARASAGKLVKVEAINQKIAGALGTTPDQILIDAVSVNPISHNAYLAVSRGRGPDATPVLMRVKAGDQLEVVSLEKVKFSRVALTDAPSDTTGQANSRRESITDMVFFDNNLLVAGLSNEEFSSTLRSIPFPFKSVNPGSNVEIYHGSHGRVETRSPIRTVVPFKMGTGAQLLPAYTCTPLVRFPISDLKPGAKIKGRTIAELGNRNRPLDMIVYEKGGKTFLLMANSSRGVMKISTDTVEREEAITAPVSDKKGLPYETVEGWTGIEHLDKLDSGHALVLRRADAGTLNLESLPLP